MEKVSGCLPPSTGYEAKTFGLTNLSLTLILSRLVGVKAPVKKFLFEVGDTMKC